MTPNEAKRLGFARRIFEVPGLVSNLRFMARLSQDEVAQVLEVSQGTVSQWEVNTRTPRGATAVEYLDLLVSAIDPDGSQNLVGTLQAIVPRDPYNLAGLQAMREAGENESRQDAPVAGLSTERDPYGLKG